MIYAESDSIVLCFEISQAISDAMPSSNHIHICVIIVMHSLIFPMKDWGGVVHKFNSK